MPPAASSVAARERESGPRESTLSWPSKKRFSISTASYELALSFPPALILQVFSLSPVPGSLNSPKSQSLWDPHCTWGLHSEPL